MSKGRGGPPEVEQVAQHFDFIKSLHERVVGDRVGDGVVGDGVGNATQTRSVSRRSEVV
jgi:hypothetical protein